MHRRRLTAVALCVVAAIALRYSLATAELENQVFTSKPDRIRIVVPRGWRATDQPSYPGFLLWMLRSQPEGKIVLTSEAFTHELYCSWPPACRSQQESLPAKYACALSEKFKGRGMRVSPTQGGPKENEQAGVPSVWIEYDDTKHFFRQAFALSEDRAFTLVLSASSEQARAQHSRSFEQALRTLRPLTPEELGITPVAQTTFAPTDAGVAPLDAAQGSAMRFETAPAPISVSPVGPCTPKAPPSPSKN